MTISSVLIAFVIFEEAEEVAFTQVFRHSYLKESFFFIYTTY
ncbi:hypothetical protein [Peribacillus sp. NPDC096540]